MQTNGPDLWIIIQNFYELNKILVSLDKILVKMGKVWGLAM